MNAFKAWANVVLFGGLGVAVMLGHKLPRNPDCWGRCYVDTMAELQDRIGNGPLALILFGCAIFGYVWFTLRS